MRNGAAGCTVGKRRAGSSACLGQLIAAGDEDDDVLDLILDSSYSQTKALREPGMSMSVSTAAISGRAAWCRISTSKIRTNWMSGSGPFCGKRLTAKLEPRTPGTVATVKVRMVIDMDEFKRRRQGFKSRRHQECVRPRRRGRSLCSIASTSIGLG